MKITPLASSSQLRTTRYELRAVRGFTIVELLVSIAIFSLVTSFGVTVFVRSLRAQRSVVALISANDNASLAIEAVAREIRRGRDFSGDNGADSSDSKTLRFFNAEQHEVIYRFEVTNGEHALTRSDNGSNYFPVTAKNIVVEEGTFAIRNTSNGRPSLPRVTIAMRIGSPDRDIQGATTQIHTTVSSRGLNNPVPSGL